MQSFASALAPPGRLLDKLWFIVSHVIILTAITLHSKIFSLSFKRLQSTGCYERHATCTDRDDQESTSSDEGS